MNLRSRLIDFLDEQPALRARCIWLFRCLGVYDLAVRIYVRTRSESAIQAEGGPSARTCGTLVRVLAEGDPTHGNRIIRDGADVEVFFATRRNIAVSDPGVDTAESIGTDNLQGKLGAPRVSRSWFFRAMFILTEPILARLRTYLLDGMEQRSALRAQALLPEVTTLRQEVSALRLQLDRLEAYSYMAARRVAIHCGEGHILIRTEVGYVLCPEEDHALLAILLERGELETGVRRLIERYLRPGDVFVDAGANIGLHVLAAARTLRGRGEIHAFEPFPSTCKALERTLWINGESSLAKIWPVALSMRNGSGRLHLGATCGHHSLFPLAGDHPGNMVEVNLLRLDDAIQPDHAVTLMKVDVEGAELEVIQGAQAILRNNPDIALIVEFGPSHIRRAGHSVEQWFSQFSTLGFKAWRIDDVTGELDPFSLEDTAEDESVNLFFARDNSGARTRVAMGSGS